MSRQQQGVGVFVVALVVALALGSVVEGALVNRWSFSEAGGATTVLVDSVGGAHGVITDGGTSDATVGAGQVTLAGGARANADYVTLPADLITAGMTDATIETWATQHTVQNWSRIFDFGSSTSNFLHMSWSRAWDGNQDRAEFNIGGASVIDNTMAPYTLNQQNHIVMTLDGNGPGNQTLVRIYKDGQLRGQMLTGLQLTSLIDNNNWIGRSEFGGDNTANASYNELRIYNSAIDEVQIQQNAADGPDTVNLLDPATRFLRGVPLHRWSFNESGGAGTTLVDTFGGADATIVDGGPNDATAGGGQVTLTGGAKGSSDYVQLPGGLVSGLQDATIETWATQHAVQSWARIWDFGANTTNNMLMSWSQGTNPNLDAFAMKVGGVEQRVENFMAPYTLDQEFHIVATIDENAIGGGGQTLVSLYLDGQFMGAGFLTHTLSQIIDTNMWLGRSQYGDSTASASYNELRIYGYALTNEEVMLNYLNGPGLVAVTPEPGTMLLLGGGLLALVRRRRKRA